MKCGPAARLPQLAVLDRLADVVAAELEEGGPVVEPEHVALPGDLDRLDDDVVAPLARSEDGARLVLAGHDEGRTRAVGRVACARKERREGQRRPSHVSKPG